MKKIVYSKALLYSNYFLNNIQVDAKLKGDRTLNKSMIQNGSENIKNLRTFFTVFSAQLKRTAQFKNRLGSLACAHLGLWFMCGAQPTLGSVAQQPAARPALARGLKRSAQLAPQPNRAARPTPEFGPWPTRAVCPASQATTWAWAWAGKCLTHLGRKLAQLRPVDRGCPF